jgi:tetratricopeptide (TPR) repeat protein
MRPGDIVVERFEVERLAGSGGMGAVWRARDRLTGQPVALKVIHGQRSQEVERFGREARVLAQVRHPGVVRYVAHGAALDGAMYLAMEWLEGEDLGARLARAPMTIAESMKLAELVADALATAHAQGVVHRDIKPGNLFLPGGAVDQVKVLDFGIASVLHATRAMTVPGAMVGTPGYMAPEQARAGRNLDARVDVFALGCVLFECLTGRAAFAGDQIMAVLAKILLEDAPAVRSLRPDVPEAVGALVARMLSKEPEGRPADGAALAAEIRALGDVGAPELGPAPACERPAALTRGEQRLLCVVLADRGAEGELRAPKLDPAGPVEVANAETVVSDPLISGWLEPVRGTATAFGARAEQLADGSIVVTHAGMGAATDQAARAARSALVLRALIPGARIALATGRGDVSAPWPVGEAIDRAARLLGRRVGSERGIVLDDVTAGLLDARFDVGGDERGLELLGEQEIASAARTLLGKPTPCVGRDRELRALRSTFDHCAEESVAQVVLVTAPAGVGKSRLRHEFLVELAGRDVVILLGNGDPVRAGAPFGLIAPALRRAAGVLEGEPIAVRQHKIRARVARHVGEPDRARVAEFLGEIVGAPFPDAESVQLRAARAAPMLMGDQMGRAWEDFLAAECGAQPVLLLMEDLHWGDLPSVKFVDAALRNLADRPFMVLALARPEVLTLFPSLWAERNVTHMGLGNLSRKASERLVRQVLGEHVAAPTVERLVAEAQGNAFYLEELLRAAAEGKDDALPGTVIAMVQSRLDALDPESRRALRAASVFGQVFWSGGVETLLGGTDRAARVDAVLDDLVEREVIERRGTGKLAGEREHAFRHALVREAAYAMLTDADRSLGHRLAAEWLAAVGETESVVIAEHFERGGEARRAVGWYRRAADQALGANDVGAVLARAERGVACGAEGEDLGALRLRQAEAHSWRSENIEMESCGLDALKWLPRGSPLWCAAVAETAAASQRLAHPEIMDRLAGELCELFTAAPRPASSALLMAAARVTTSLHFMDREGPAASLHAAMMAAAAEQGGSEPALLARIHMMRAHSSFRAGNPGDAVASLELGAREFERAGDVRNACVACANVGFGLLELGDYEQAERALRQALAMAERMRLVSTAATAKQNLGTLLGRLGAFDEALALEREAVAAYAAQGEPRMEGMSRAYVARILAAKGELSGAEHEARAACELLKKNPGLRASALADLAQVLLSQGRAGEALASAREAAELLESLGQLEEGEALVRLAHAECLHAVGDRLAAASAITAAEQRLLARAEGIADPRRRESFLARIPENARTLALVREWRE